MTTDAGTGAAVTMEGAGSVAVPAVGKQVGQVGQVGTQAEKGSFRVPAERGRTSIANSVVEKIAGMAAREVIGVHDFGGSLARSLGAVRDRVPGGRPRNRGTK
jgi:hypothetical protein